MKETRQKIATSARRVVVKLGSSILRGETHTGVSVNADAVLADIVTSISSLMGEGTEVVLVSSGSVALGMKDLGIGERPKIIPEIQAIAAVGQGKLMSRYSKLFSAEGGKCAQVLLTHDGLADRKRFLNARNTVQALLNMGIVPVINENDTVAVEEIKFGDNDNLSALATNLVEADMLIILTDIDGLYDG
ncbi:MAG: glutamate 5-kinase, partial [bacterium]|nr:glutamate 5-kinase [bacterium]